MTDLPDQGVIFTNYQCLPAKYIINHLFPVSSMYAHSVLVLGIVSLVCVLKFQFVFLLFLFIWKSIFSTAFRNRSYTFVACFYNE